MAFADDWSLFCRDLQTLFALRPLFQRFECASGQRINIPKSGILPTRPMTRAEQCCVRIFWGTIQILDKARILGLWIGFAATIDDQYAAALDKFSRALQDFSAMRPRWSLAMRIAIANSFMLSLFSFVNRFFFMPTRILQQIENRVLSFLSKVPFTRLGLLAHLKKLYGINSEIRDLRLSNVSALLSTYIHNPRNHQHLRSSLQRFADAHYRPGAHARPLGRPAARLDHPTCAWQCARSYFDVVVGQCPNELYERELPSASRRRHLDLVLPSIQSTLYKALQFDELASWSAYLRQRVAARGMNPGAFARGLRRPLRGLTQLQRWHLFRLHVNGHMSSTRLHAARQAPVILPCALCGRADDSARHVFTCPTVLAAFRQVEGALPPNVNAPASWNQLFFQSDLDTAHCTFTMALFTAAWGCRGAVHRGGSVTHLAACIARAISHPWLLSGGSSTARERRAARIRAPLALHIAFGLYRCDGAFAAGPHGGMVGAWGAAWWAPGAPPPTPATAYAAGLCPDPSSNNIAEFYGFRECLRRALRAPKCHHLVFELDSMLVVMFMLGNWGCHRDHLRVLLQECHDLGEALIFRGCPWTIRHVYREFNTVADQLAGKAIQESQGQASPRW